MKSTARSGVKAMVNPPSSQARLTRLRACRVGDRVIKAGDQAGHSDLAEIRKDHSEVRPIEAGQEGEACVAEAAEAGQANLPVAGQPFALPASLQDRLVDNTSRDALCTGQESRAQRQAVVGMVEDGNGNPLDVGRKTRTIPPAIRRALQARDGGCRFPGAPIAASSTATTSATGWPAA